jgi:hypothetical protein
MTGVTERWTPPTDPVPSTWAAEQPPAHGQPAVVPGPTGWGAGPGWGGPGWTPPPPIPKPGIIPLRPLGIGEILDGAISAIRSQPRLMLGLSALVAVATQLLSLPVTWLLLHDAGDRAFSFDQPATTTQEEDLAFAASSFGAAGIQVVVTLTAVLLLTGILTVAVSRAVLGDHISAGAAWERARPRMPALLGVTLLVFVIEIGVFALALGPGILLAAFSAPTAATVLAFVAGVPLALATAVYLYVAFALAPVSVVLERAAPRASLRRSRELVKGAWWRTFGILLLVNVLAQLLANILTVPFVVLSLVAAWFVGDGDSLNMYALLPLVISGIGTIVASAITWPFTAVSTTLLYVDRRIRREALDIELARAAGTPLSAPRR